MYWSWWLHLSWGLILGTHCRILQIPQNPVDMTSVSLMTHFHCLLPPHCSLMVKLKVNPPLCSGFYGVFIHVLWLLQQHDRWGPDVLVQHPSGVHLHCCFLLLLLFHLYRGTVSSSISLCVFSFQWRFRPISERTTMISNRASWEFSRHLNLHICLFPDSTRSMGTAARVAVAAGGGAVGNYSMIVFTSWDYGCTGEQATKLKQKNIHYQLQVRGGLSKVWIKTNVVDMRQFFFI